MFMCEKHAVISLSNAVEDWKHKPRVLVTMKKGLCRFVQSLNVIDVYTPSRRIHGIRLLLYCFVDISGWDLKHCVMLVRCLPSQICNLIIGLPTKLLGHDSFGIHRGRRRVAKSPRSGMGGGVKSTWCSRGYCTSVPHSSTPALLCLHLQRPISAAPES